MPTNVVTDMAMDYNGYLWIGTQTGLIRYDGTNLASFLFNKKGVNSMDNTVRTLMNIPLDRKLMVRTLSQEVYSIENGKPVLYSPKKKSTGYYFFHVQGHFPSLSLFDKYNLPMDDIARLQWANEKQTFLNICAIDEKGFMVKINNGHILYYKDGVKEREIVPPARFELFAQFNGYSFMMDDKDSVYLYDAVSSQFKKVSQDLTGIKSTDKKGDKIQFYPDTYSGETFAFYNDTFYQLKFNPGRNLVTYIPLFVINGENLWSKIVYDSLNNTFFLSTVNDGIFQVRLNKIKTIDLQEKMPAYLSENVAVNYSILRINDTTVVATSGFEITSTPSGLNIKRVNNLSSYRYTIGLLPDSTVLCAKKEKLIVYSSKDGFIKGHSLNDSLNRSNHEEFGMVYPEGDSVWISTRNRIICITKNYVKLISEGDKSTQIQYPDLHFFYRINKDKALIANERGTFWLKTSPPYTIEPVAEIKGKQTRHVLPYKDVLILSVYHDGLYVVKDNRFYKVPVDADLTELSDCHSTYIDANGNIWMPTNKGLYKSSAASVIESALHPGTAKPFFFYYGKNDGIENIEFNGAGLPTYAVIKSGQLFYPSMGGIVTLKPEELGDKIINSPLFIDKLSVDNNELDLVNDSIQLEPDANYLAVQLAVPNFGEPKNLSLEYRYDSTEWKKIPATSSQLITLVHISSGWHKLVIRKRVGFGNSDFVYKTIFIEKGKQIYERVWFFLLILLAVVLIVWIYSTIRNQRYIRKQKELQKLVDAQTSELSKTAEVKDLLISIISHDMMTPLKHIGLIAGFLEKGMESDPEKVTSALSDIRTTSNRILNGSSSIIKWMNYNNKRIIIDKKPISLYEIVDEISELYKPAAGSKGIIILNEVPELKIVEADYNILNTILNNIISNAVRYSESGQVRIFLDRIDSETGAVLKISDTGIGMNDETLNMVKNVLEGNIEVLKTTIKINTGLGYLIIAELVKMDGITVDVESVRGEGTTVSVMIK